MPCPALQRRRGGRGEAAPLRLAALPGRPCPPGSSAGERLMLAVSFVSFSMVTISMAFDLSNLAYVLCLISSGMNFVLLQLRISNLSVYLALMLL